LGHHFVLTGEVVEDSAGFLTGENDGQMVRLFGAGPIHLLREFDMQDMTVEEEQGAPSLVLSVGGNVAFGGQVGDASRGGDFGFAHVARVAQVGCPCNLR